MKKETEQHARWIKEQTTQYLLRFTNATGIPNAIQRATNATGETKAEYMKKSIIQRLQKDGFIDREEVVLNMNKDRHIKKLERLEKYIEQERKKMK